MNAKQLSDENPLRPFAKGGEGGFGINFMRVRQVSVPFRW